MCARRSHPWKKVEENQQSRDRNRTCSSCVHLRQPNGPQHCRCSVIMSRTNLAFFCWHICNYCNSLLAVVSCASAWGAQITNRTIREVANTVFAHLQQLDLSFHLSRRTGALSRTIDRGTRGINFIVSSMVFNVIPTTFEVLLVAGDRSLVVLLFTERKDAWRSAPFWGPCSSSNDL